MLCYLRFCVDVVVGSMLWVLSKFVDCLRIFEQ